MINIGNELTHEERVELRDLCASVHELVRPALERFLARHPYPVRNRQGTEVYDVWIMLGLLDQEAEAWLRYFEGETSAAGAPEVGQ